MEKPGLEQLEKGETYNQNSRHNPAGLSEEDLAFLEGFSEDRRKKVLRKVGTSAGLRLQTFANGFL